MRNLSPFVSYLGELTNRLMSAQKDFDSVRSYKNIDMREQSFVISPYSGLASLHCQISISQWVMGAFLRCSIEASEINVRDSSFRANAITILRHF